MITFIPQNCLYKMDYSKELAICCMPGGYRGIFVQGVLNAFETRGIRADAYSACSSSVLIAAYAAFGKVKTLDLSLWKDGYRLSKEDADQSRAMLNSIQSLAPDIKANLWEAGASRFLIAASRVKTAEAALLTQSGKAKRLGRELLLEAARRNPGWKNIHLELNMFDTAPRGHSTLPLTKENFDDAAYASTRMLQAWNIPATINGLPYIDGSYTTLCPAAFLSGLGYKKILCICTETGGIPTDFFAKELIPSRINDTRVHFIQPDSSLKDMGVDYLSMQDGGPEEVFYHGYQKGMLTQ